MNDIFRGVRPLVTVLEICDDIKEKLYEMAPLLGVVRVEYATLPIPGGETVITLLPRTDSNLTRRMAATQKFQYPAELLVNNAAFFKASYRYFWESDLLFFANEALVAGLLTLDKAATFDVAADVRTLVVTVPDVHLSWPSARRQGALHKPLHPWAMRLLQSLPFPSSGFWAQIIHVPDVPRASLSARVLDQCNRLSIGWNYLPLLPRGHTVIARKALRQSLHSSHVLVSY